MHKKFDAQLDIDILKVNSEISEGNLNKFEEANVKAFDFMGAIGSGKTLLIEGLIDLLKPSGIRCGVIAGDVAGDDDYKRFKSHDVTVTSITTGKECHLDAHMIEHQLEELDLSQLDVLFIENVGNLVCPSDFPLGTQKRVVVISVTEGDDMVRKHPVIFGHADVIVINKIDISEAVEVDIDVILSDAKKISPHTPIVCTDAKHGQGLEELRSKLGL
ncbi:MAG: hydrogenase nickel incorporation protein HypB [Thermoplasmata archaeon]|nr:MAG: hydrogenase nickel incorporation protein HypB [Thermoplasmata archaeon]